MLRSVPSLLLVATVATGLGAAVLTTACGPDSTRETETVSTSDDSAVTPDPHSFATADVAVEHLDLDLTVDFESRRLEGTATLRLDRRGGDTLVLDTRDLEIRAVRLDDDPTPVEFTLDDPVEFLGSALRIPLAETTETVAVDYASSPDAGALLWLEPEQTAGGTSPFLFTQSQAILARTWVPIQDSPGVRFTYDATVQAPPGLFALMSAENPTEPSADGTYSFSMPQPIPAYLLALAVGDLRFESLGEHTGVYAEPPVLESAAYEFADTEEMLEAVEDLYGDYRWGRYDLLVLPAGFPFGGMENPRLTFVTPTILAGDRSLVALVAHELAHSWSGNLVTNATWNDFWLNEGFTVYLERRIMEAVEGPDYAAMLALLGQQDLESGLADLDDADQHLYLELEGRDPDDGMTDIAYEKGYFFLRRIEEVVGRDRFDAFLSQWFDQNAFQTATTDDFVAYLEQELITVDGERDETIAEAIDLDAWIHGAGLPESPGIESARFAAVDRQLEAFAEGAAPTALDTDGWTTHEWLRFLRGLPDELPQDRMAALDAEFALTETGNSELLHAWLHHVIASEYEPGYGALEEFLTGMGRRKFLQPLYQRMADGDDAMQERARGIYRQARPGYHSVSSSTIDGILDWNEAG